jgi:hypothetical protein
MSAEVGKAVTLVLSKEKSPEIQNRAKEGD